jgi:hypothetical protein
MIKHSLDRQVALLLIREKYRVEQSYCIVLLLCGRMLPGTLAVEMACVQLHCVSRGTPPI